MRQLGLAKYDVCGACRISDRLMTDYLAGRKAISAVNLQYIARYLSVDPEWLQPLDEPAFVSPAPA
jgi:hypothetical protein